MKKSDRFCPSKDFTGCVVSCKDYPYLNGRKVVKTLKQIPNRDPRFPLYEVQLNHNNRHYFLYEHEMLEVSK